MITVGVELTAEITDGLFLVESGFCDRLIKFFNTAALQMDNLEKLWKIVRMKCLKK